MPDAMRAVGQAREKSALQFVLALRTRLEKRETPLDREVDRLVVAKLEVQIAILFQGTPVAPVEIPTFEEVQGRGHGDVTIARQNQQDPIRHAAEDALEKALTQVGNRIFLVGRR